MAELSTPDDDTGLFLAHDDARLFYVPATAFPNPVPGTDATIHVAVRQCVDD